MSHSMKSVSLLLYQGRNIRLENTDVLVIALQRCSGSVAVAVSVSSAGLFGAPAGSLDPGNPALEPCLRNSSKRCSWSVDTRTMGGGGGGGWKRSTIIALFPRGRSAI